MSHAFHNYLAGQLDKMLRDDRVVVFYDPRGEFGPFLDEFEVVGTGLGELPRICMGDTLTHIARFEGSFFSLKSTLEPVVAADKPEPILIYLSEIERDRQGSVLMELELAGNCYEPQLRRLARRQLRKQFTDGDIDDMLAPKPLSYHEVVRFLGQTGSGSGSLVKLVLGGGSSEDLISKWLSSEVHDAALEAKLAQPELYKLVNARLGLQIDADTPLGKARHQTLRYVLVNEFRSDLGCAPPDSLSLVPEAGIKEEHQRISVVASTLRDQYGDAYMGIADSIEAEFGLAQVNVEPSNLGSIDTFRFEERSLLTFAATLIASGQYAAALDVVDARGQSFWVDHSSFLGRLAQWEACGLMATLGLLADELRPQIQKTSGDATKWIQAYAATDGWYRVDRAQRELEAWIANMEDEPEEPLERALGTVRRKHESLLEEMAKGFTKALAYSEWQTAGLLHQTEIYPELVESKGGRVAYFFVDAMRYEMGEDLIEQLEGAEELTLQPAVGVLPSITPLGMGALLPGASSSFSVVEYHGRLATQIGDHVLPDLSRRRKYLAAVRPDAREINLGALLQLSTKGLGRKLGNSKLIIVPSSSIDKLGETDGGMLARQIMDSIIGNIARAVRKLARTGVEYFVITSDHGHQFSVRKDADMIMDKPGGDKVGQHRRAWAGHGAHTPAAAVRVSGAQLGYQTDLDFIFPRGLAVFRCGGDLAFHHGGISLQEMVIPVVTLRMDRLEIDGTGASRVILEGCPAVLSNRTFGLRISLGAELFSEPLAVRLVLVADGEVVGRAGMAPDAELDRASGTVTVLPGKPVSVGMMLTRDDCSKLRVVAQDPETDTVLAQSMEIVVSLGI